MRKLWGGVLVLGAFFFLALWSMPARAQGMDRSRPYGSDYLTFAEELRTQGALNFYNETEDRLRTGKFEQAFTRYLYLKANIRGQALYAGLSASVDQRLQFLKEQMHLGEGALKYEYRETYAQRKRRAKPACPPSAKKPAKPKEPSSDENPPETIIPAPAPDEKAAIPPKTEAKPPVQEAKPPGQDANPPAEGAQKPAAGPQQAAPAPAPTPSPSFWEKFKRKLKFW